MTLDQDAMTAEIYSEFYTLSQQATREALKAYDLSEIDRENLILETKQNKKSLVYKLFMLTALIRHSSPQPRLAP
jgi:hypothetical protein